MIEVVNFGSNKNDVVELHIYNTLGTYIDSNYFTEYSISQGFKDDNSVNSVTVDLRKNLTDLQYNSGKYVLQYTLCNNILGDVNNVVTIRDISTSRTEIRIVCNTADKDSFLSFNDVPKYDSYNNLLKYRINFGRNNTYDLVNWILDTDTITSEPYCYVLKLSKPLELDINVNDNLFIQQILGESVSESIVLLNTNIDDNTIRLRAPNFNIITDDSNITPTLYKTWNDLLGTNSTSSYSLVNSLLSSSNSGVNLNIDYRSYSNFVFYGSAAERLKNFRYKLQLLEYYDNRLSVLNAISGSTILDTNLSSSINNKYNILSGFDSYEKYLYYESSSYESGSYGEFNPSTWPKTNSTKPYSLANTNSTLANNWYNNQLASASLYDDNNQYALTKLLPTYLLDDTANPGFLLFVNMIGQYFDTIYQYINNITNTYSGDESLSNGLSKDMIFNVIRSFGLPVQYGKQIEELWLNELGVNSTGSYASTGSIQSVSSGDYTREVWKRIFNNLPYLLKTKGTERGIRALINCYGIPDTVLRIKEYSGPEIDSTVISKRNVNTFSYALDFPGTTAYNTSSNFGVNTKWFQLSSSVYPKSIELRLKGANGNTCAFMSGSSTVFCLIENTQASVDNVLSSIYTNYYSQQSASITMAFSSSIGLPTISASTPIFNFYDDNWRWMLFRRSASAGTVDSAIYDYTYTLDVIRYKYGKVVEHVSASLFLASGSGYNEPIVTNQRIVIGSMGSGTSNLPGVNLNNRFTGSIQEYRVWNEYLDYNTWTGSRSDPKSIQGNSYNSAYNNLLIRYSFTKPKNHYTSSNAGNGIFDGTNIGADNVILSCHPNQSIYAYNNNLTSTYVYGVIRNRQSVIPRPVPLNSAYQYYNPVIEDTFTQWPNIGSNRELANKIKVYSSSISSGTLLNNARLESDATSIYPLDSNKVGIYLSPLNEINEDIAQQLGAINLDDYIGNPAQRNLSTYPDLNIIHNHYSLKYNNRYNFYDYFRLVEQLDASLFYLLKSFIPAKAAPIVGYVVEPNILERSKVNLLTTDVSLINNTYQQNISLRCEASMSSYKQDYLTTLNSGSRFIDFNSSMVPYYLGTYDVIVSKLDNTNTVVSAINTNQSQVSSIQLGQRRAKYLGTKISGSDFNIPSTDTPDGGPVVEFWSSNPNIITIGPNNTVI